MPTRSLLALAVLAVLVTAACIPPQYIPPWPPWPESEYAAYDAARAQEPGAVDGQVFLRTRGGDIKYGAGSEVELVPVTTYSQYWAEYHAGRSTPPPHPQWKVYRFTTQADGEGRFAFTDVPPAEYFVRSAVTWRVYANAFVYSTEGGYIVKRITVDPGGRTTVQVTL